MKYMTFQERDFILCFCYFISYTYIITGQDAILDNKEFAEIAGRLVPNHYNEEYKGVSITYPRIHLRVN